MNSPDKHTCPHCSQDIQKAEAGVKQGKIAKSKIPYETVKEYEKEFKSDFGTAIGEMNENIMRVLNSYAK